MKLLELSFQDWIRKNKIKNIILNTITAIFLFVLFFSMSAVDSNNNIFYITIIISMCWLVPFGIANGFIQI